MSMYAVGTPGQMPRQWVEASSARDLMAQCRTGEVSAPASVDDNGQPIPAPLPTPDD